MRTITLYIFLEHHCCSVMLHFVHFLFAAFYLPSTLFQCEIWSKILHIKSTSVRDGKTFVSNNVYEISLHQNRLVTDHRLRPKTPEKCSVVPVRTLCVVFKARQNSSRRNSICGRVAEGLFQARDPKDDAFIESLNGWLRRECLNQHWLLSLDDACVKAERITSKNKRITWIIWEMSHTMHENKSFKVTCPQFIFAFSSCRLRWNNHPGHLSHQCISNGMISFTHEVLRIQYVTSRNILCSNFCKHETISLPGIQFGNDCDF